MLLQPDIKKFVAVLNTSLVIFRWKYIAVEVYTDIL
jgi:hypothetical protein